MIILIKKFKIFLVYFLSINDNFAMTESEMYFTLLIIAVACLITYVIYIIFDICFLIAFKRKTDISKKQVNILLYQKGVEVLTIYNLLKPYSKNSKKAKDLVEDHSFNVYEEIKVENFREVYVYLEDICHEYRAIISENKAQNLKEIEKHFDVIKDINKNYFAASQIYNSNVTGYNYWRNLFLTKWMKNMLKIKEFEFIN